jgi:hypothetical protein
MNKILFLLVLKTLWRIPAAFLFLLPLIAPLYSWYESNYWYLLLTPVTPLAFFLLAKKTSYKTTHFNQPDIQRYKLPSWLAWMETPDEHLPGGLYEPTHAKVYKYFGWIGASMYWLLLRNVGSSITWNEAISVGPIYDINVNHNSEIVLAAVAAQVLIDNNLTSIKYGLVTIHWELTKDFYGTKSNIVSEDWRKCNYVAKPEIRFN